MKKSWSYKWLWVIFDADLILCICACNGSINAAALLQTVALNDLESRGVRADSCTVYLCIGTIYMYDTVCKNVRPVFTLLKKIRTIN